MSMLYLILSVTTDIATAIPDPAPVQPPGTEGVSTIIGWAKWGGLALCALAIIGAGASFAWARKHGEGSQSAKWLGLVLVAVMIISGGISLIGFLSGQ